MGLVKGHAAVRSLIRATLASGQSISPGERKTGNCMPAKSANQMTSGDLLRQVLLDYLLASKVVDWPGGDGLTEDDILNCYPQASAAGEVPDRQELCRRHAELVAEILSFFTLKGWLGNHDLK